MTIAAGSRLGPYEILAPLGAGGMGEVYKARDGKLSREVAIKVLPEAFAVDGERLARFRREAQVLAALNHLHIAAIYGHEESVSVLELVEGETLAERLVRSATDRRGSGDCAADRQRARGRAREGNRSPGLEAGQHLRHLGRGVKIFPISG